MNLLTAETAEERRGAEADDMTALGWCASQLKPCDHRVGLLINFNVARLKDGIVRMVNRL